MNMEKIFDVQNRIEERFRRRHKSKPRVFTRETKDVLLLSGFAFIIVGMYLFISCPRWNEWIAITDLMLILTGVLLLWNGITSNTKEEN